MKVSSPFVSGVCAILYGASAAVALFVAHNWFVAGLFGVGAGLFAWLFWRWQPEPVLRSMKPLNDSEEEIQKAVRSIKEGRDIFKDWVTEHGTLNKETGAFVHACYSIYLQASNESIPIEQFANVTDAQIETAVRRVAVQNEKVA